LTGRSTCRACSTPSRAATIAAAINAYTTHDPPGTPPELRRSIAQRRADALYDIA
jgi:hypothetical protein